MLRARTAAHGTVAVGSHAEFGAWLVAMPATFHLSSRTVGGALDELSSGGIVMGDHHFSLQILSEPFVSAPCDAISARSAASRSTFWELEL